MCVWKTTTRRTNRNYFCKRPLLPLPNLLKTATCYCTCVCLCVWLGYTVWNGWLAADQREKEAFSLSRRYGCLRNVLFCTKQFLGRNESAKYFFCSKILPVTLSAPDRTFGTVRGEISHGRAVHALVVRLVDVLARLIDVVCLLYRKKGGVVDR